MIQGGRALLDHTAAASSPSYSPEIGARQPTRFLGSLSEGRQPKRSASPLDTVDSMSSSPPGTVPLRNRRLPVPSAIGNVHHVEQLPGGITRVEQRQQIRTLQVRGDADLAQEALGPECCTKLRIQDLDGDLAVMLQVAGRKTVAIPPRPTLRMMSYVPASASTS